MQKYLLILIVLIFNICQTSYSEETKPYVIDPSRDKAVKLYLKEFSSIGPQSGYPKIYEALVNSLNKLPKNVFRKVTNRHSPIIFISSITTGIARYAHATEFNLRSTDRPALQNGFYLIVLGDELNNAPDVGAIEGVILHEIAHDYLGHLRQPVFSCQFEREANRTVKQWGYEEEYKKASDFFGAKNKGDSNCSDPELENKK